MLLFEYGVAYCYILGNALLNKGVNNISTPKSGVTGALLCCSSAVLTWGPSLWPCLKTRVHSWWEPAENHSVRATWVSFLPVASLPVLQDIVMKCSYCRGWSNMLKVLETRVVRRCRLWKTTVYWSWRLTAIFFYQRGIEVRSWQGVCLGKKWINRILWKTVSSSVSGKQTHLPSNHSLNNQDFRELLEYA